MLEKDRFLEIKNLAQNIRNENENLFEAFKMESPEDAIREKEEFVETIIDSMEETFSEGENGKEEKQIFRANILIPDDDDFLDTYSKDKNIRNLMNTYGVGIEDVMSKITELNIYADYLEESKKSKPAKVSKKIEEKEESEDFVDAMVNLSTSDAASLLDEIENLSNAMEEFNITDEESFEEPFDDSDFMADDSFDISEIEIGDEPLVEEKEDVSEETDYSSDMSIDDISEAVDGFVDDYNSIQADLDKLNQELKENKKIAEEQKKQIKSLREEAYSLRKNNLESVRTLKAARQENEKLENENAILKEQVKSMEDKLKRSSILLKKIYNSIPRK